MIEKDIDDKTNQECVCDYCKTIQGQFNVFDREDFLDMVEILKSKGVRIRRMHGVWHHWCSPECELGWLHDN